MKDFDDLVAEFLAAQKSARARPRWLHKQHPDFAQAKMIVGVPGSRAMAGALVMTAHRVRMPPKYSFALLFRGKRVLGLDVNPGRNHKNLLQPGKVSVTHWQRWPVMDAEPDERNQNFSQWLSDFLKAANIVTTFRVLSPPRGVQLRLIVK